MKILVCDMKTFLQTPVLKQRAAVVLMRASMMTRKLEMLFCRNSSHRSEEFKLLCINDLVKIAFDYLT